MFVAPLLLLLLDVEVDAPQASLPDPPPASWPEPATPTRPIEPLPIGSGPRFVPPRFTLGVLATGTYTHLFETAFLTGGLELRMGVQTRIVEISGRVGFQAGGTPAGLLVLSPTVSLGFLFRVPTNDRVRLGFEVTVPPFFRSLFIHYVTNPRYVPAALGVVAPEVSVDLYRPNPNNASPSPRALFWVAQAGVCMTTDFQASPVFGPHIYTGLGYRM